MQRHEPSDLEWARLEPLLPKLRIGRPSKNHRPIIDALLWLAKTGAPWRSVATRFYRWTRSGLWERILPALRRIADARGGIGRRRRPPLSRGSVAVLPSISLASERPRPSPVERPKRR